MELAAGNLFARPTIGDQRSHPIVPRRLELTVNWRHRIIRVPRFDDDEQHDAVLRAVADGWIFSAQEHGDGDTVDLIFRRARAEQPRVAWS